MSRIILDLTEFPSVQQRVGEHVDLRIRGIVYKHEAPLVDVSGYDQVGNRYLTSTQELEILIERIEDANGSHPRVGE